MWHVPLPGPWEAFWLGRPAVDGGRVFVQATDQLLALDAATGATLWSRPVRAYPAPAPTTLLADAGRVFVSETDSVLAVDATTGRTVWNFHPDSQAVVVPALDDATFYTGQRGLAVVYALDRATGALRWRVDLGAGHGYAFQTDVKGLAVRGDTVYANITRGLDANYRGTGGVLVALDRRDGRELWRYETTGDRHGFMQAPLPVGRLVVAVDLLGATVVAYDPAAGRVAWTYALDGNNILTSTASDGVVYVARSAGDAAAVDAATGAERWRVGKAGAALGSAVCAGGYFVNDERLRRIETGSGAVTATLGAGSSLVFTSGIAADGQAVYFTGENGAYAVACR